MKNLISKVTLLLLCSVFVLVSCNKASDPPGEKQTVTAKYRILVSARVEYRVGVDNGGIEQLYNYIKEQMLTVSNAHDKASWTITETAETEQAAIAACDKKAIAIFNETLSAMNEATDSIAKKFEAKKLELASIIATDLSRAYINYIDYGPTLFKGKEDDLFPSEIIKTGTLVNFSEVGGGQ